MKCWNNIINSEDAIYHWEGGLTIVHMIAPRGENIKKVVVFGGKYH